MSETETRIDDPKERKARYKASLNLPQTPFPMKANLAQAEPQTLERWRREGLYEKVLARRAEADPFVFHDGPPYANGDIHVGHLLNKVLKDIAVRTHAMAGQLAAYVPGWDCHGLPIEHRVMTDLLAAGKMEKIQGLPEDARRMAVRRECARYAQKYQEIQTRQMRRLLTFADYEHPYLTLQPAYERGVLAVFADLVSQGLVYRDKKPVHWSIANETALAEAELEYRERHDPSAFVAFVAADAGALAQVFDQTIADVGRKECAFLVWTTTPWTLPANRLIAVNGDFEYALVDVAGRRLVIAEALVDRVVAAAGHGPARLLGTVKGAAMAGIAYRHPFCPGGGRIVTADHVTLEDGTGLVHTAPGHGQDDYLTGLREGVEIYSPVGDDGTFDATVPEWLQGLSVWEGNSRILERLAASGHLFHQAEILHSYPHDWRSKTPVIVRATEQWFIGVDLPTRHHGKSLRELSLAACDGAIEFIPAWGANRLRGMLEARPDWCISRQRAWGLPIPSFRLPDGSVFLTAASVAAVAEVFGREGSDAWFTSDAATLLAAYDPATDPEAPAGLEVAKLTKCYDIFDVWFESGSSWHAVLRQRGLGFPAELYLEGSDQHRGWFQLSLLPALGVTGAPPFKALLTHGFMVDKDGKKMSKSLGNTLEVDHLLQHFGADVCRWWVSSLAFENDVKVDLSFFEVAGESYRKVRNTLRFLLSNLYDFKPELAVPLASLPPASLDTFALAATAALRRQVVDAFASYELRQAHLALFDFCNETLSSLYLQAVKDRLYCDRPGSPRRRATQTVLWQIAETLVTLLAPILPHTADEAWRALHGEDSSVHTETIPHFEVAADPRWPVLLGLRETVQKALEDAKASGIDNPLDAGVVVPDPEGSLAAFAPDLPDLFGVSRVVLQRNQQTLEVLDLREEPRCERSWRRDETVREREDGGWLSDRDALAVGFSL